MQTTAEDAATFSNVSKRSTQLPDQATATDSTLSFWVE
jgi:hypothetical protein